MGDGFAAHLAPGWRHDTPKTAAGAYLLAAIERAELAAAPFEYRLLEDLLPEPLLKALAELPFAPPAVATSDGRRESANGSRVYFTPDVQAAYPVCRELVEIFSDPAVIGGIARMTGADLTDRQLRIEHCQDADGFWLEPHLDLGVKRLTLLIYLSDDPALADAGTDIYDAGPEHRPVARAPYAANRGLVFVPGHDTWHGFTPRPINGLRKSLIVNSVGPEWRSREELAEG